MSVEIKRNNKEFHTSYCKKITSGHITEFIEISAVPVQPQTQKISKTEYVDLHTGEVKEYELSETRADNKDSLRKTFKRIRQLINANCVDAKKIHWVTLTYRENMTDTKQLYLDFDKFLKRFKYYCKKQGWIAPEYICVIEPQKRGAWHCHVLFIWQNKAPYIANNAVFAPMWSHGFTKIQALPVDCDNIGAYLSAYLVNIPVDADGDNTTTKKAIIKGGRLSLYPVGLNIVRHSKNIKQADSELVALDEVEKEKASAGTLTFKCSYAILDENGNERYITKSYYNTKRK